MTDFIIFIARHWATEHVLIVLGFIFILIIGQRRSVSQVESMADQWVEEIMVEDPNSKPTIPPSFTASESEKERLLEQIRTIRARARHHFSVMKFFYSRYYMAISIVLVLGLIAAIALFFITKNGWNEAKSYLKTVFITATALTTYLGAFPRVFQQSQNIADNKKLYLQYIALHDEVMSYFSLQQNLNGEEKKPAEFIHYIDKQLINLNRFAIGFDDTKVPNHKGSFDVT